jgi:hypothetical protein
MERVYGVALTFREHVLEELVAAQSIEGVEAFSVTQYLRPELLPQCWVARKQMDRIASKHRSRVLRSNDALYRHVANQCPIFGLCEQRCHSDLALVLLSGFDGLLYMEFDEIVDLKTGLLEFCHWKEEVEAASQEAKGNALHPVDPDAFEGGAR